MSGETDNADDDDALTFPLGANHRDELSTQSGRELSELTLERIMSGELSPADVSIRFKDEGVVNDSQKKGWFGKLWDKVSPF